MLRMQALSILSVPHPFLDPGDFFPISAKHDPHCNIRQDVNNDDEENTEEQEFTFTCTYPQGTLIFADEIFEDGKIRPIFHAFDQSLLFTNEKNISTSPLKKLFVEQRSSFCTKPIGVSKEPLNEPSQNMTLVEVPASHDICTKSNSTGFSKLRRFRRDLKLRSNSDGKDAFVFLNPNNHAKPNGTKVENVSVKKGNGGKCKSTSSAHEKLYVMNRMRKESNKRRSFLPYKQHLVGFFSSVNIFSKNIHPF